MIRRFPALSGAALLVVGFTLACAKDKDSGTTTTEFDTQIEVDCIGMGLGIPLAGQRSVKTRFSDRCVASISDTTWGGELVLWDATNLGVENGIALTVNYAGHTYLARTGTIRVDWVEDGVYAKGVYDVVAYDELDQPVRLHGEMDWCDFADSEQCPYRSDVGELTKAVEFSMPDNYSATEDTWASDCRVLIDPTTEAVQVDMQLGMVRGMNTGMAWLDCEYTTWFFDRFTFRSGGVPGPGTYSYATQGVQDPADPNRMLGLPGFDFRVPELYYGQTCLLAQYELAVTDVFTGRTWDPYYTPGPAEQTSCTFTIQESPGRFELDCANAHKIRIPEQFSPSIGDFHLAADCDVRYR